MIHFGLNQSPLAAEVPVRPASKLKVRSRVTRESTRKGACRIASWRPYTLSPMSFMAKGTTRSTYCPSNEHKRWTNRNLCDGP